jgi:hypothetical protein
MIVTRLYGGLGNQLFQYAAGRSLAHHLGTTLKLDISAFRKYTLHAYGLNQWNIQEDIAVDREVEIFRLKEVISRWTRKITGARPGYTVFREKHFHFCPDIFSVTGNVMLMGYWQSEKYFLNIEEEIRKEIVVKTPQLGKDLEIYGKINETDSISLHVRRLDYVTNAATSQTHGTCSLEYYNRSVDLISQRVKAPHVFVFSDDSRWAREHLRIPCPVSYLEHNDASRNFEDLRLMSQCKHNIIANSTFSWWGAWLNANPGKVVCAPARWFSDPRHDTRDIYPEGWLKI